ncbi:hypothetical protein EDD21DRAFT_165257 [Dissophora ornata]|nr:hypothetical protein EDD21DRAFT_165257 [Dissophora ornata]
MEKIIIAGGGLGGLLLAILLEKASLDYMVLERSTEAKMPLEGGGVISITSQIQPLLQQLGLLDALRRFSRPVSSVTVLEIDQPGGQPRIVGTIDSEFSYSRYQYYSLVISRPELYNYLVDQIPTSKLLLGKQVQDVSQNDSVATCICADGSQYQGIVIGADGAYSSVRLSLYRQLRQQDLLAAQDYKPMKYEYRALVGMTKPLDPDLFKLISGEHSNMRVATSQGSNPFSFWCVPMTGNRLCWMLDEPLTEAQDCPDIEDWSAIPQAVNEMCGKYRAMQSPIGGILIGGLFDSTPTGTMLSLPREEGFYSTWAHGRIALMGDACHKALPYGGQPFVQAGYDAAWIANALYAHSLDPDQDVTARLLTYETERHSGAKEAVEASHRFGKLLNRQGWIGKMVRYFVLNYVPQFILHWVGDRLNRERPQVDFLPRVIGKVAGEKKEGR